MNALVGQRDPLELVDDVPHFHGIRFQEISASGHVEKQMTNGNLGTNLHGHRHVPGPFAALHVQLYAAFVAGVARLQLHVRDGSDGSQCLTTESFRNDSEQVVGAGNFRRSMPIKAALRIGLYHPRTVVQNVDEGAASVNHPHIDARSAGIHRVFHQFLDRGSGPLDDLTSGNLVRYIVRQLPYHLRHPPSTLARPKNHWFLPKLRPSKPTTAGHPQ